MLIRPAFGAMRLAHISTAFVGLMWVLPFLYYVHTEPITTFYQEWAAAMLGLFAMPLLVTQRFWQQPAIPRIVLLPIGLSLLVWLQFAMGRVVYLDQALLLNLYLLWAVLLIMLGHRLREEIGLPALATVLAVFLLLGAELSAWIGVAQHFFKCTRPDFLYYLKLDNIPGMLAGNLAQPNHFANYITLGLVSLGLLRLRLKLRLWQVVLLAIPLLFVLSLSGSRSPWLYLLCLAGLAFLWQRRDKSGLPLLHYSLLLALGYGLMHFIVQLPWLAGCSDNLTSGERMIAEAGSFVKEKLGGSPRLHLWHEACLIFTQFPLLGAGFGQFGWQHFQLGPVLSNPDLTGAWNNAHNLVLQVAAEMGLTGLIVLLGTLALWFWQARAAQRTIYHWWGYGLLAVLAIHSLLEYPLWHAFFLGVAALTLGIFDTTTYRLKRCEKHPLPSPLPEGERAIIPSPSGRGLGRGLMGRWSVAAMLLLGFLSLLQMLYVYKYRNINFEVMASALSASGVRDDSYAQRVRIQLIHDNLVEAQGRSLLLRPYVEKFLGEAGWDNVADKGALNERVMHYEPFSSVVYRQALLLARAGRQEEARVQMERAIWAYPDGFPANRDKLRALADLDKDPKRFPALLEFALQKYEERQNVIHAKP